MLAKATPRDFIAAAPAKMCITCGELASFLNGCRCGNDMNDKSGHALINAREYRTEGNRVLCTLAMNGYPPVELSLRKEHVKNTSLALMRESKAEIIAIHVNGKVLREQITRYKEKES